MNNPIKPNIRTEAFPILLLLVVIASSFYFYARFPERVPMHWNFQGEVDNWGSRTTGAFMIPAILFGMYIMFLFLPLLDPKEERYAQFRRTYHIIKNLLIFFMAIIYFMVGFAGLGYEVNIGLWVPAMVGLLFMAMGNYMGKLRRNWFMGIRTPWTLSSETVWNKTHRLGGKLFILSGLLLMAAPFLNKEWGMGIFIASLVVSVLGTLIYSLIIFKIEKNAKDNQPGQSEDQGDS